MKKLDVKNINGNTPLERLNVTEQLHLVEKEVNHAIYIAVATPTCIGRYSDVYSTSVETLDRMYLDRDFLTHKVSVMTAAEVYILDRIDELNEKLMDRKL